MLQSIRERATGWIAWVVFGLICIPFALWGVNEYFGADPNPVIAKVNGTEIGLQRFQQAYSQQRQRLRAALGPDFDEGALDVDLVRDQTLEQMISDEALLHAALAGAMRISDQQVAATIRAETTFARDGAFSQDSYQAWLRGQGFNPASFEFRLRRSLLSEQLSSGIAQTAVVTDKAAARLATLLSQQRSFSTLTIPLAGYLDRPLPPASVSDYFQQHTDDLVIPERVVVDYVVVSRADVAATVAVDEDELRARYESQKVNFATPEQRKVSHLLIQVAPDASESDVAAAEERIAALREEVVAGRSFAEVAAESSEDTGSAGLGGDLGFIARGVLDKGFEDAAFSQAKGEIGAPVRSAFGLHLILVTEIKKGAIKSYEETREQLRSGYQQEQAERIFFEQVERLANLTFEVPDSLEPVADTLGLDILSAGPFSRDGDDSDEMFSRGEVLRAIFSEDVLDEGNNSQPVDLGDGRVVVARVRERLAPARQTLEQARPEIEAILKRQNADETLLAHAKASLERLRAGESPDTVAAEFGGEWVVHENISRNAAGPIEAEVLDTVFRMPRAATDGMVFDTVTTQEGGVVLVALRQVTDVPAADAVQTQLRQAIALGRGRLEFQAFVQAIRDRADVRIYQETLLGAL